MLRHYRAVFGEPGTAAFCLAGLVMRTPMAMYAIGLVLIIAARTGHYGFAGVLSGTYVLGAVPGNPLCARWIDRYGQSRVLLPATAVHALSIVVIGLLLWARAPLWTLVPPTFVMGFAYVSVPSVMRARWSYVLAGRPELSTAFSLESTLDEVVFVAGPLLATVIATQLDPVGVLVAGVLLVTAGACRLATLTRTEPPPHPAGEGARPSALRARGMPLLLLACVAMGGIFAGTEVSIIAFCGQHHERAFAGVVLACFAGGSGTAGFLYGTRTFASSLLTRFRLHTVVFALLPLLLLAGVNIPVLAVCAFVVGLGIAPTLITGFGLVGELVPAGTLTEGLAWLTTGLSLGYGMSSAGVGKLADLFGAREGFWVPIGSGLLMGLCAVLLARQLRPAPDGTASQPAVVGAG